MHAKTSILAACILMIIAVTVPLATSAFQLAPQCGSLSSGGKTVQNVCTFCDIFVLIQNIFNFAWKYIAFPLGALMLAFGGFAMILPGFQGTGGYNTGKKIISNALIGLAIIFLAWIGIDTLMKAVSAFQYNTSNKFGPWNSIQCGKSSAGITTSPTASLPSSTTPTSTSSSKQILSDSEAAAQLSAAGISTELNGATLDGIYQITLDALFAFKQKCGCEVTVTGGSGYKIYFEDSPEVTGYIENNYTSSGTRVNDGTDIYKSSDGSVFYL